ncbi:TPA: hypothetical protein TVS12_001887 [Streptococcus equi subsp. zooepidemicus]|nr:hypothetical protein [Streptococcus equi subsp. zooepidemicus]
MPKSNKKDYDTLASILELSAPNTRKLELIAYNIKKFSPDEILNYINSDVLPVLRDNYFNNAPEISAQRRLLLAYDLLVNGDFEQ